jgi:hypothetical protein
VTESQWGRCPDPQSMLDQLRRSGQVDERKLRLFAVACCRRVGHLLTDERSQEVLDVSERYADGLASGEQLTEAAEAANAAVDAVPEDAPDATYCAALAAYYGAADAYYPPQDAAPCAAHYAAEAAGDDAAAERAAQAALLRCLCGNPFRPVPLNPSWWTPAVVALATAIDEQGSFDRLPELAEALAAADCTDADLLAHLRGPGPHVRGCWVVDLLLGKD